MFNPSNNVTPNTQAPENTNKILPLTTMLLEVTANAGQIIGTLIDSSAQADKEPTPQPLGCSPDSPNHPGLNDPHNSIPTATSIVTAPSVDGH